MKFTQGNPLEILTNNHIVIVSLVCLLSNPNSLKNIYKRQIKVLYEQIIPSLQAGPLGTEQLTADQSTSLVSR